MTNKNANEKTVYFPGERKKKINTHTYTPHSSNESFQFPKNGHDRCNMPNGHLDFAIQPFQRYGYGALGYILFNRHLITNIKQVAKSLVTVHRIQHEIVKKNEKRKNHNFNENSHQIIKHFHLISLNLLTLMDFGDEDLVLKLILVQLASENGPYALFL